MARFSWPQLGRVGIGKKRKTRDASCAGKVWSHGSMYEKGLGRERKKLTGGCRMDVRR